MRVPRSISVVRGTKIATFRKSSFSYAKIEVSGIFAHDQRPRPKAGAFFPRVEAGRSSVQGIPGRRPGILLDISGRVPAGGQIGVAFVPWCLTRASIRVVN